jgi:hypothetical protein
MRETWPAISMNGLVASSGPCELGNQRVSVIVACDLPIDPLRAYRRPLGECYPAFLSVNPLGLRTSKKDPAVRSWIQ